MPDTHDTAALTADRRRVIDDFLTDWLSEHRIPGAAVAVVADGETVYSEGYGARDLASNTPATAETLYGVASVTKSFTALAVLQQVERTELELADPITEYLDVYAELDDPPTIHELLCHSSGMPSDGVSVALISRLTEQNPVEVPLSSDADLDRHVSGALGDRAAVGSPAALASDERPFFYYNTGYTMLGRLVAELDGRDFPAYVAGEILAPLGMDRSRVAPESLEGIENAMTPYKYVGGEGDDGGDGERPEREETVFPVKGVGAAGGLLASVTELAEYLAFHASCGTDGSGSGSEIIDPGLLDEAHQAHATRQTYLDGAEQGYGYGWMRRSLLGDTVVEHGGSLGVSTAYVGYLEDAGIGVALACNDSPEAHPQYVGPALLALLENQDPAEATRFYALREKLERVAGEYESHRGIASVTVDPAGGTLDVTFETALGEQSFSAHPETTDADDLTFYTVEASGAKVPLTFVPGEEDDVGESDAMDLFYQRWRLHGT
jgi:CubicO group peptidase (beta-lactamase class C family)